MPRYHVFLEQYDFLPPILFVEWTFECPREVIPNLFAEGRDRIHIILLAKEAKPPMSCSDMLPKDAIETAQSDGCHADAYRYLVVVDDLEYFDAIQIACVSKLCDGCWLCPGSMLASTRSLATSSQHSR